MATPTQILNQQKNTTANQGVAGVSADGVREQWLLERGEPLTAESWAAAMVRLQRDIAESLAQVGGV